MLVYFSGPESTYQPYENITKASLTLIPQARHSKSLDQLLKTSLETQATLPLRLSQQTTRKADKIKDYSSGDSGLDVDKDYPSRDKSRNRSGRKMQAIKDYRLQKVESVVTDHQSRTGDKQNGVYRGFSKLEQDDENLCCVRDNLSKQGNKEETVWKMADEKHSSCRNGVADDLEDSKMSIRRKGHNAHSFGDSNGQLGSNRDVTANDAKGRINNGKNSSKVKTRMTDTNDYKRSNTIAGLKECVENGEENIPCLAFDSSTLPASLTDKRRDFAKVGIKSETDHATGMHALENRSVCNTLPCSFSKRKENTRSLKGAFNTSNKELDQRERNISSNEQSNLSVDKMNQLRRINIHNGTCGTSTERINQIGQATRVDTARVDAFTEQSNTISQSNRSSKQRSSDQIGRGRCINVSTDLMNQVGDRSSHQTDGLKNRIHSVDNLDRNDLSFWTTLDFRDRLDGAWAPQKHFEVQSLQRNKIGDRVGRFTSEESRPRGLPEKVSLRRIRSQGQADWLNERLDRINRWKVESDNQKKLTKECTNHSDRLGGNGEKNSQTSKKETGKRKHRHRRKTKRKDKAEDRKEEGMKRDFKEEQARFREFLENQTRKTGLASIKDKFSSLPSNFSSRRSHYKVADSDFDDSKENMNESKHIKPRNKIDCHRSTRHTIDLINERRLDLRMSKSFTGGKSSLPNAQHFDLSDDLDDIRLSCLTKPQKGTKDIPMPDFRNFGRTNNGPSAGAASRHSQNSEHRKHSPFIDESERTFKVKKISSNSEGPHIGPRLSRSRDSILSEDKVDLPSELRRKTKTRVSDVEYSRHNKVQNGPSGMSEGNRLSRSRDSILCDTKNDPPPQTTTSNKGKARRSSYDSSTLSHSGLKALPLTDLNFKRQFNISTGKTSVFNDNVVQSIPNDVLADEPLFNASDKEEVTIILATPEGFEDDIGESVSECFKVTDEQLNTGCSCDSKSAFGVMDGLNNFNKNMDFMVELGGGLNEKGPRNRTFSGTEKNSKGIKTSGSLGDISRRFSFTLSAPEKFQGGDLETSGDGLSPNLGVPENFKDPSKSPVPKRDEKSCAIDGGAGEKFNFNQFAPEKFEWPRSISPNSVNKKVLDGPAEFSKFSFMNASLESGSKTNNLRGRKHSFTFGTSERLSGSPLTPDKQSESRQRKFSFSSETTRKFNDSVPAVPKLENNLKSEQIHLWLNHQGSTKFEEPLLPNKGLASFGGIAVVDKKNQFQDSSDKFKNGSPQKGLKNRQGNTARSIRSPDRLSDNKFGQFLEVSIICGNDYLIHFPSIPLRTRKQ